MFRRKLEINLIHYYIMDTITDLIRANRPGITDASVETYAKIIRAVHGQLMGKKTPVDIENLKNPELIEPLLEGKSIATKRNYYVALFILFPEIYGERKDKSCNECNEHRETKEFKEQSAEKNIIEQEVIDKARKELTEDFNTFVKVVKKIHDKAIVDQMLLKMNKYVLFALYFTEGLEPRRAADYYQMKYRNYNKEEDNYYDVKGQRFVFNKFKRSAQKGTHIVFIPTIFHKQLKLWIKCIPSNLDTLLFEKVSNEFQMIKDVTNYGLILQEIFGKGHSVNAIRHTIFHQKYGNVALNLEKLHNDAEKAGTSLGCILNDYVYEHLVNEK